jgi:hypothetical protein
MVDVRISPDRGLFETKTSQAGGQGHPSEMNLKLKK